MKTNEKDSSTFRVLSKSLVHETPVFPEDFQEYFTEIRESMIKRRNLCLKVNREETWSNHCKLYYLLPFTLIPERLHSRTRGFIDKKFLCFDTLYQFPRLVGVFLGHFTHTYKYMIHYTTH